MSHYNEDYFDWQRSLGEFGGKATVFMFEEFIKPTDRVLDFGAGGGFLLKNLNCAERIGIEINDSARNYSNSQGVKSVASVNEVEDGWADVIISNHALEHTFSPLDELKSLYPKLKKGGLIVVQIPNEKRWDYNPSDINQHLYTWSAMSLGNLLTHAGFKVVSAKELRYRWPPRFRFWWKVLGKSGFNFLSKLYANYNPWYKENVSNVRVAARKE